MVDVVRWDDVSEEQRFQSGVPRGCAAATRPWGDKRLFSQCSAPSVKSVGFCRKHAEQLGLLEPVEVVRARHAAAQHLENHQRYLGVRTIEDVAQLRTEGYEWPAIETHFRTDGKGHGLKELMQTYWGKAGYAGVGPEPGGYGSAWRKWHDLHDSDTILDLWLSSLVGDKSPIQMTLEGVRRQLAAREQSLADLQEQTRELVNPAEVEKLKAYYLEREQQWRVKELEWRGYAQQINTLQQQAHVTSTYARQCELLQRQLQSYRTFVDTTIMSRPTWDVKP